VTAPPGLPALRPPGPVRLDVPVRENGEPLVPVAGAARVWPVYSWLGFRHGPAELRLRAGLLRRIERAARKLPPDFDIVVIDAHRTRAFQAELRAYYHATTASLGDFVADPWSDTPVPPHTTGGAVDLTLGWRGAVLGLGSDFDAFVPESAPAALETTALADAAPETSVLQESVLDRGRCTARDLRRLLAMILGDEGLTVIGTEWWHWSYGDQYWAAQTGAPAAIYDETA
jgi:D-alanyl-D-alanine dipeptidase